VSRESEAACRGTCREDIDQNFAAFTARSGKRGREIKNEWNPEVRPIGLAGGKYVEKKGSVGRV